jgi:outer membrane lipase/esterase
MAFQWMRQVLLALAPAALLALTACGSGTIEQQFTPMRIVAMGDGLTDQGNTGKRWTVNDPNQMWPQIVALNVDPTTAITPSSTGGTNYAYGNSRIVLKPDAAGSALTPTLADQITTYLAANGGAVPAGDLVMINGGTADVIVQMQALRAGTITQDQFLANVAQAGHDLAAQAKRLTAAGGLHVVVVGVPDLKNTPWATTIDKVALLSTASTDFNNAVLVDLVDEGDHMLFTDIALLWNLMTNNPASYNLADSVTPVCTSVDPGPGIGIGTGQVSSTLCTPTTTTTVAGATYLNYMWADAVYPTPVVQARIADYVYSRVHARW